MTLTKQQQKSYDNFNKYSRLVVFSPRRGGKTQLAKYIVEQNPDKKIGIFTPIYDIWEKFKDYKNCELILAEDYYIEKTKGKVFDIVIGEEQIVSKDINAVKKISLLTPPYCFDVWSVEGNQYMSPEEIERIKRSVSEETLKSEFFIN
jgi:AAA+ ATPase superfamily predicted ATPase